MPKRKPGRKKKPPISKQELIFAQTKVLTGSTTEAKKAAGYDLEKGTAPENNKAVQYYMEEYKKQMDQKFMERANDVAEELYQLVKGAKSETAKLGAIKDWLDRAGLAPINKQEIDDKRYLDANSRVNTELINRLMSLKQKEGEE